MSKTRLNERSRNVLRGHARALVEVPSEKKAADAAHAKAAILVQKMIEARYPPKDMVILKRYEKATDVSCIQIQLIAGGMTQWQFHKDDAIPLQPGRYSATFLADKPTTLAVQSSLTATEKQKAAYDKKLADYYSLISAANTFEDVCEVWPEAEAVRSQCGANAIVIAVTPDVVARIRADVAARVKVAA